MLRPIRSDTLTGEWWSSVCPEGTSHDSLNTCCVCFLSSTGQLKGQRSRCARSANRNTAALCLEMLLLCFVTMFNTLSHYRLESAASLSHAVYSLRSLWSIFIDYLHQKCDIILFFRAECREMFVEWKHNVTVESAGIINSSVRVCRAFNMLLLKLWLPNTIC